MRYMFLRYPEGKYKAVTLSYDDGCYQDKRFASIITKFGLKCTFNLNSDLLGVNRGFIKCLSTNEIKENILAFGHEVAIHGANHKANGNIRAIDGIYDVLKCRLELEKEFGQIVRGMAYPDTGVRLFNNGTTYERVKQYLTDLDIIYSRTTASTEKFDMPSDWHSWNPTAHHNNENIFELINTFVDLTVPSYLPLAAPKLFYLWGHSYEFDKDNNWDKLEKICELLSDKSDIWYATNGEIYDYVKAYDSLIISADGSIIYNPSLVTVWFFVDGKGYSIKSGETLNLE